ncbi:pilus assembly PilX family protein [Chromatium okenii]|uniref:Type 4 fimbrial biogenesis protein PilX N-terminal domain-containing protein n=1 Tax=Chromatium okenii TaxID=61644 RepID=A0A2S7XNJ4_9GAMM|nr:PilX N-terminal domain-containing pilus assembly protein [Chromatium okenii]MBV5309219.1 hypothetical protein [Chromatium okenii]PQJ95309.1 hypothetical protein CXB77_13780 [Chromatium okenii]
MLSQLLNRKRQSGMVLVTGLIFLLLMTVLGMTSVQTTTLNERMASNLNDRNVAFQAAEVALRRAENQIVNAEDLPTTITEGEDLKEPSSDDDDGWTDEISVDSETISNVIAQPVYVTQLLCRAVPTLSLIPNAPKLTLCNPCDLCLDATGAPADTVLAIYRVIARGQGAVTTSVVVLETTVARIED